MLLNDIHPSFRKGFLKHYLSKYNEDIISKEFCNNNFIHSIPDNKYHIEHMRTCSGLFTDKEKLKNSIESAKKIDQRLKDEALENMKSLDKYKKEKEDYEKLLITFNSLLEEEVTTTIMSRKTIVHFENLPSSRFKQICEYKKEKITTLYFGSSIFPDAKIGSMKFYFMSKGDFIIKGSLWNKDCRNFIAEQGRMNEHLNKSIDLYSQYITGEKPEWLDNWFLLK